MRYLIILFNLLLITATGYCQTCPTTNLRLETQTEVDNFSILYPDCTELNIFINVGGKSEDTPSDITSLQGLEQLVRVNKRLHIENNPNLESLAGLENLKKVTQSFIVDNNQNLSDITQLTSLDSSRTISLFSNPLIKDYSTFQQLSYVNSFSISENHSIKDLSSIPDLNGLIGLGIYECDSLENLDDLEKFSDLTNLILVDNKNLHNINHISTMESLEVIDLRGLDSLENLNALNNIDSLASLTIGSIPKISSLNGLNSLKHVRYLTIYSNENLVNLSGLDSLNYANYLTISSNNNLVNLNGLNSLNITRSLSIDNNASLTSLVGLENLINEEGNNSFGLEIEIQNNNSLVTLNGLNNLESANRVEIINNDLLTNLQGIENLKNVAEAFIIRGNDGLITLDGYTPGNLSFTTWSDCFIYYYDDIGIIISDNSSLENLDVFLSKTYIGNSLMISNNDKLETLDGLKNIKEISGNILQIKDNDNLQNLQGLNMLERIGYESSIFEIINNPKIQDLSGLSKLNTTKSLYLNISDNENLTTLDGLKKPIEIGIIRLNANQKLANLTALNNLESIDFLTIIDNDLLTNLDKLGGITSSVNSIRIQNNELLSDITGLSNVEAIVPFECYDYTEHGYLTITDNPLLQDCAIMPICDALVASNVSKYIQNNGIGCSSPEEINCDDVSISGFVFYDFNQNGIIDNGENGIANIPISFDPPNLNRLTKPGGKYFQVCEEGIEYNVSFPELDDFSLTTPNDSYNITFAQGNDINTNNNFGIYHDVEVHNVTANISSNPTRCNDRVDFFIAMENIGSYQENGTLRVDFDSLSLYSWSLPKADSINLESNFLLWNIDNFSPFDVQNIKLRFDMPDETYTGTLLKFTSSILVDSTGTDIIIDEYTYSPTVLCSFDPNDKLVMPAGVYAENYTLKNEKMTYTVRFQNTGNAPAIDVTIVDTISSLLDLNTFRIVNSSFPPQASINEREITFLFKDINLVDSLTDERNSHGFVTYEIYPIEEIKDYSEIENTAHIIFDSNAAIVTNTVKNTMVTTIPTSYTDQNLISSFEVYPNPVISKNHVYIDCEIESLASNLYIIMYNILGQEIKSQKCKNGMNEVNLKNVTSGVYFIGMRKDGHVIKTAKISIL
jgi:uncharacterized repeat protein (TIGR01451 family)